MSGHLDGPPPGPPDPPYIPGDLGAPSAKEFARRRAGDRHMNDNPYPNASDTMHYELHTAWDEGYAEGFAAGRAAATPDTRSKIHGTGNVPAPDRRASPDERLREALLSDAAVEAAAMTYEPDTFIGDAPYADDALRDARAVLEAALAAADREAPDGPR